MKTIIGLTGSFGSGCSYLTDNIIVEKGYRKILLSDILRQLYYEENPDEPDPQRTELQKYGDQKRESNGPEFLAKKAQEIILSDEEQEKWVIDSIKNPNEIKYLKSEYSDFYLIGVFADPDIRWERVKDEHYRGNSNLFEEDDKRDQGEDLSHGQSVTECFIKADIIICNNEHIDRIGNDDFINLKNKVNKYLELIEQTSSFTPKEDEALMAMAYANSLRSRCCKRKVGAVIMDLTGNVFSSGFNDVPSSLKSCKQKWNQCYRDYLRDDFKSTVAETLNDETEQKEIVDKFNGFKILDLCRALHAEESAILNVARFGSSNALGGAKLYTTTYPCNLCANKIAKAGIKYLVYLEPYPVKEAKDILENYNVQQESFEGVTFNGYFRFLG